MEKTTLYFPDDLQRRLKEVSYQQGKSQASVVREAVAEYLERAVRPQPASLGLGEDSEVRASEAKEWVRRSWDREL